MGKFENFKQKVKENKGKIIATSVTIAGVVGVIVYQGDKIKNLQSDVDLLKDMALRMVLCLKQMDDEKRRD